mmetsp:Transcript_77546/g.153997  ORF Transcript_77546/g.153997 Transcript_77546/m.153997 type:complete len:81 (-) Transcript_77546:457-699(-)
MSKQWHIYYLTRTHQRRQLFRLAKFLVSTPWFLAPFFATHACRRLPPVLPYGNLGQTIRVAAQIVSCDALNCRRSQLPAS